MAKYIVKEHSILYKEVEANSPEEAEEIAMGEPVHSAEEYIELLKEQYLEQHDIELEDHEITEIKEIEHE